ncbi:hypothetical protein NHX12_026583 [Muraenolepis orangiensis]|uniref:Uncharacterized protein n=1 Tax=Muraenolepis orangiensis TaxID=630683 RepID=A0A9Q0EKA6_9TELE|nr:hypothetical protein NHX12_026583 [Muraenolepis orangiensis]
MYVHGVDDNFEVMEELLTVIPMHDQTTAQEIFRQLCDAIVDAGLPWKRFAGITTDKAPSMTGRRNGLVALVQRKLGEEGVEEAIALHCIIHQQALCSKCLTFDNVMSVVVKCINHQIQGLKAPPVQPGEGDKADLSDMRSLSGGERSFSTVCFVLSLWAITEAPFRCLDEFDVFMDMVNRRISMDMMLKIAKAQRFRQFIFLTPQSMR